MAFHSIQLIHYFYKGKLPRKNGDRYKQVDILISKNQLLQILYFKHHVYKTS